MKKEKIMIMGVMVILAVIDISVTAVCQSLGWIKAGVHNFIFHWIDLSEENVCQMYPISAIRKK